MDNYYCVVHLFENNPVFFLKIKSTWKVFLAGGDNNINVLVNELLTFVCVKPCFVMHIGLNLLSDQELNLMLNALCM
jgi:hypothetical protein